MNLKKCIHTQIQKNITHETVKRIGIFDVAKKWQF